MKYLAGEEILVIHARIIEETGGSHGVRDVGLFLSILEKPKMKFGGKELYPGVFEKASAYFESLANYHVFIDGNKRTALASTARFLFLNSYKLAASNREVELFTIRVVKEKLDVQAIARWLKNHSRKLRTPQS